MIFITPIVKLLHDQRDKMKVNLSLIGKSLRDDDDDEMVGVK